MVIILSSRFAKDVIDLLDLPYGEELFMDPTHLNLQGAKRFTMALRQALRENPALAEFFP